MAFIIFYGKGFALSLNIAAKLSLFYLLLGEMVLLLQCCMDRYQMKSWYTDEVWFTTNLTINWLFDMN